MKTNFHAKGLLINLLLLAFFVSCAAPETPTSEPTTTLVPPTPEPTTTPVPPTKTPITPTPEPTATRVPPTKTPRPPKSCEEVEGNCLTLTFTGKSCTYEGPTEISAGQVDLLFYNDGIRLAAVNFLELLEGKTYQDVIEYSGEEPSTKHAPSWSRELGTWQPVPPGERQHWRGELEPGNYFMVCARLSPLGVWMGTGLTVEG